MTDNTKLRNLHPATLAIRQTLPSSSQQEHSSALYLTSSFKFASAEQAAARFAKQEVGNIYGRYTNPNSTEFIDKICALEGADAGIAAADTRVQEQDCGQLFTLGTIRRLTSCVGQRGRLLASRVLS